MYPHLQAPTTKKSTKEDMTAFEEYTRRFGINKAFATKLLALRGYEIAFICDDSGSMRTPMLQKHFAGHTQQTITRWEELKKTVSIVVDLASSINPDGVDIYFLNRNPIFHVHSSRELAPIFAVPPEGMTPIARVFRKVLQDKRQAMQQRKLLILLATDGVPTNDDGAANPQELYYILSRERNPTDRIPVTIISCTDDKSCVSYMNDWDQKIPNLDVVSDYQSEKEQILACQGSSFPFSFGDYVVKILLGGVDSWFDNLDEQKVSLDPDNGPKK